MELIRSSLSTGGPVRPKNEDSVGFWEPADIEERQRRGAIAVIADGVGGHGNGDVASRTAVDIALEKFREAKLEATPKAVLRTIFEAANLALYDQGMSDPRGKHMATTLTVGIFRGKELHIGHVGDTRMYLIRQEELRRLTSDHSATGLQLKLRLMTEHEARASHLRSLLTRSVGADPVVRWDYKSVPVRQHDRFLQCSDGLYCFVSDDEIAEGVDRLPPEEICPYLVSLAERRGTDDNLTAQLVVVNHLAATRKESLLSILAPAAEAPAASRNDLQPGELLDGRFRIEEIISRSGMATIYKAQDEVAGRTVALKVPHLQFESDVAFFSRFEREAEIGRRLDHPNILRFYDVPGPKSRPYIVMEYLRGRTLAQVLNEVRPLPVPDAVQIAVRIADALTHMHERGIIHRDLKPQNIMICDDGSLRIMDFGIARGAEMRRLTFVGLTPTMGTPDYMAPEQVKGRRGDARTDIYSLGAMLYEMVTGAPPFKADNPFLVMNARLSGDPVAPREINPGIPPELEEIILHAMERDPRRRYQSAAEMKAELEDFSLVKLTGRHRRLRTPKVWSSYWHHARLIVFSALIPIFLFALIFLMSRLGHHR